MKKVAEFTKDGGKLEIFEDFNKNIFLAKPHGIANPSLVEEDLSHAKLFSKKVGKAWFYVTNTEDLFLANPLNLIYLKEVKKLPHLKEIVIYAPNWFNRFLLKLASPLIQPDRILKTKKEFQHYLGFN